MRDRSAEINTALILPVPSWAAPRAQSEADAGFAAAAALFSLDAFLRSEPVFLGCFRQRLALANAQTAVRLAGREEDEAALRDAIHLSGPDGDPGPAGRILLAYRRLAGPCAPVQTDRIKDIAGLLGVPATAELEDIPALFDDSLQRGRAAPFAVADMIAAVCRRHAHAEPLGWWLGDRMLATVMGWRCAVPLMMAQRAGPAFRLATGRGRIAATDEGFARAVCLALVDACSQALQRAADLDRRAARLIATARTIRTKGAEPVLDRLLQDDSILAGRPGSSLSRWAGRRFFERLEALDAVRELSGRATFRIYGL